MEVRGKSCWAVEVVCGQVTLGVRVVGVVEVGLAVERQDEEGVVLMVCSEVGQEDGVEVGHLVFGE